MKNKTCDTVPLEVKELILEKVPTSVGRKKFISGITTGTKDNIPSRLALSRLPMFLLFLGAKVRLRILLLFLLLAALLVLLLLLLVAGPLFAGLDAEGGDEGLLLTGGDRQSLLPLALRPLHHVLGQVLGQ
jgi:hypothetical protein